MSKVPNQPKIVILVIVMLILIQFVIQVNLINQGQEFAIAKLTNDDSFYYIQAAWNFREFGFPTFDGMNSTNGVQFLWYWLLVAVAYLAPSKGALFMASLLICMFLNIGGYIAIWIIGRKSGESFLTIIMSISWFYLTARWTYYLNPMESSLHASLFWMVLVQMITTVEHIQNHSKHLYLHFTLATILLSLIVWTRIDSAIYSLALYVYLFWELYRHSTTKKIVVQLLGITGPTAALFATALFTGLIFPRKSGHQDKRDGV